MASSPGTDDTLFNTVLEIGGFKSKKIL